MGSFTKTFLFPTKRIMKKSNIKKKALPVKNNYFEKILIFQQNLLYHYKPDKSE